jgi:hypothetical protein
MTKAAPTSAAFFCRQIPDPKLLEVIRKSCQAGCAHHVAFTTKLVVHAIHSVKPVPAESSSQCELEPEYSING